MLKQAHHRGPLMTDLFFIRHGRTAWNEEGRFQGHLNSELNDIGLEQASALGKRFADADFAHVYSSDLGRARQTAEALTKFHSVSILEEAALRERCMGVFQGLTGTEIIRDHGASWKLFKEKDPDYRMPEGESINDVLARAHGFLEHVRTEHAGEREHVRDRLVVWRHDDLLAREHSAHLRLRKWPQRTVPRPPVVQHACWPCVVAFAIVLRQLGVYLGANRRKNAKMVTRSINGHQYYALILTRNINITR